MSVYVLLKNLHLLIALASGLGFALRGYIRLVRQQPLASPMIRIGPHVIDTLLLVSGIALWVLTGLSLWSWFGLKLLLVVAYIAIGVSAFRASQANSGKALFAVAVLAFIAAAAVSFAKPGL